MKKQIINNVASNYLFTLIGMGLGFLLVPFLIVKLGKEAYGLVVLSESTIAFFEILTISVRMALSRHATFALSQNKMDEFIGYLSTGRVILFVSASIVFVFGLTISYFFTSIFRVPAEYAWQSQALFLLITIAFTISIPNIVYWTTLYAKQRFDLINFSSSFGLIMRAICLFAYFSFAPRRYENLFAYGFIYLAMTFTQNTMIYYWHKKIIPGIKFSPRYFKRHKVREILSFSIHTSLTRTSQLLYVSTANIIINILWGPFYNAVYSVCLKLPSMMRRLFIESTYVLTPTFTDLVAKNDKRRFETLLFLYSKLLAVVAFPLCFILILMAKPIILAWVGPDFAMAADLLPIYVAPLFITIPFSLTGCVINAYGKVKIPSLVSFSMAVLNGVLCLVFGWLFSWKLYGIATAAIFSSLTTFTLFFPYYSSRISGFSLIRYWTESFIKPFVLSCLIIVGGFFSFKLIPFDWRFGSLLLALGLLSAVYYLTAYLVLLNSSEKGHINEILSLVFRKFSGSNLSAPREEVELP